MVKRGRKPSGRGRGRPRKVSQEVDLNIVKVEVQDVGEGQGDVVVQDPIDKLESLLDESAAPKRKRSRPAPQSEPRKSARIQERKSREESGSPVLPPAPPPPPKRTRQSRKPQVVAPQPIKLELLDSIKQEVPDPVEVPIFEVKKEPLSPQPDPPPKEPSPPVVKPTPFRKKRSAVFSVGSKVVPGGYVTVDVGGITKQVSDELRYGAPVLKNDEPEKEKKPCTNVVPFGSALQDKYFVPEKAKVDAMFDKPYGHLFKAALLETHLMVTKTIPDLEDKLELYQESNFELMASYTSSRDAHEALMTENQKLRKDSVDKDTLNDLERRRAEEAVKEVERSRLLSRVNNEGATQRMFLSQKYNEAIEEVREQCEKRLREVELDRAKLAKENENLFRGAKVKDRRIKTLKETVGVLLMVVKEIGGEEGIREVFGDDVVSDCVGVVRGERFEDVDAIVGAIRGRGVGDHGVDSNDPFDLECEGIAIGGNIEVEEEDEFIDVIPVDQGVIPGDRITFEIIDSAGVDSTVAMGEDSVLGNVTETSVTKDDDDDGDKRAEDRGVIETSVVAMDEQSGPETRLVCDNATSGIRVEECEDLGEIDGELDTSVVAMDPVPESWLESEDETSVEEEVAASNMETTSDVVDVEVVDITKETDERDLTTKPVEEEAAAGNGTMETTSEGNDDVEVDVNLGTEERDLKTCEEEKEVDVGLGEGAPVGIHGSQENASNDVVAIGDMIPEQERREENLEVKSDEDSCCEVDVTGDDAVVALEIHESVDEKVDSSKASESDVATRTLVSPDYNGVEERVSSEQQETVKVNDPDMEYIHPDAWDPDLNERMTPPIILFEPRRKKERREDVRSRLNRTSLEITPLGAGGRRCEKRKFEEHIARKVEERRRKKRRDKYSIEQLFGEEDKEREGRSEEFHFGDVSSSSEEEDPYARLSKDLEVSSSEGEEELKHTGDRYSVDANALSMATAIMRMAPSSLDYSVTSDLAKTLKTCNAVHMIYNVIVTTPRVDLSARVVTDPNLTRCPLIPAFMSVYACIIQLTRSFPGDFKNLPEAFVKFVSDELLPDDSVRVIDNEVLLEQLGRLVGAICLEFKMDAQGMGVLVAGVTFRGPFAYALSYGVLCSDSEVLRWSQVVMGFQDLGVVTRGVIFALVRNPRFGDARKSSAVIEFICKGLQISVPDLTFEGFLHSVVREIKGVRDEGAAEQYGKVVGICISVLGVEWMERKFSPIFQGCLEGFGKGELTEAAFCGFLRGIGEGVCNLRRVDVPTDYQFVVKMLDVVCRIDTMPDTICVTAIDYMGKLATLPTRDASSRPDYWVYEKRGGTRPTGCFKKKKKRRDHNRRSGGPMRGNPRPALLPTPVGPPLKSAGGWVRGDTEVGASWRGRNNRRGRGGSGGRGKRGGF